ASRTNERLAEPGFTVVRRCEELSLAECWQVCRQSWQPVASSPGLPARRARSPMIGPCAMLMARRSRLESVRHLYRDHFAACGHPAVHPDFGFDHDLAALEFLDATAQFQDGAERGWLEEVHMERAGHEAQRWFAVHLALLGAIGRCGGSAGAVAIDQRGDQPAVDEAWNRGVLRLRLKTRHGLVAIPVGLDLVAVFIETAAAVAMRDVLGVGVLKGSHVRFSISANGEKHLRPVTFQRLLRHRTASVQITPMKCRLGEMPA